MTKRKGLSTSKRSLPSSQRRLPAGSKGKETHSTIAVSHPLIDQKSGGGQFPGDFPSEFDEERLEKLRETAKKVLGEITPEELRELASRKLDSHLEWSELERWSDKRNAQHTRKEVKQKDISSHKDRHYKANTIGVSFSVETSVFGRSSEGKRVCRVRLYLSAHEELTLDSAQGTEFAMFYRKTAAGIEHSVASAEWRKNSCTIQTQYFKTILVFDFEKDELKRITYTPIGAEEQRRESKGFMDDEGKPTKQRQRKGTLPFPELSHRAEANRNTAKLGVRVDRDLIRQMKEAADKEGIPQTDWLERAIKRGLEPS